MKIRYATLKDFDFLIEGLEKNRLLEKRPAGDIAATAADKRDFRTGIRRKTIRVAEQDRQAVAFLFFRTDFKIMYLRSPFFWIDLVYVHKAYRRQGIGSLLYRDALQLARKKGFRTVVLDIFAANKPSQKFHHTIGFSPLYTIYQKKLAR